MYEQKLMANNTMSGDIKKYMIKYDKDSRRPRHTVGLRRTGDRIAEQAISRPFRTSRRADGTDVDGQHGAIRRTR